MPLKNLKKYNVILGSASPRRKRLLMDIGIDFKLKVSRKDECYPNSLEGTQIAEFIAKEKANTIASELSTNYLLITADTIVLYENKILHKPKCKEDAIKTLKDLSGKTHLVITGVCIKSNENEIIFSDKTYVSFCNISDQEIMYYIEKYKPFDKAGSYGIQEWIGNIAINEIRGSYNNVVGLPTSKLYQYLKRIN
jgi:septum formation protein